MGTTATTITEEPTTSAPDVLMTAVLDRSGSMQHLQDATIEGFNSLIREQAEIPGGRMSLVLFDDKINVHGPVGLAFEEFTPLDRTSYSIGGMTALYDAVAAAIEGMDAWLAAHPTESVRPIIAIWTDGGENSSQRYRGPDGLKRLNSLMSDRRNAGWEFVFSGTGGAAWTEGAHFENVVAASSTVHAVPTAMSTRATYGGVSDSLRVARMTNTTLDSNDVVGSYTSRMSDADSGASGLTSAVAPTTTSFVADTSGSYEDATSALAGSDDD